MPGGIFLAIVALAAIVLLAFGLIRGLQRREAAAAAASRLGLQCETGDPLRLLELPARLFERGDRRRIEVTLHGSQDGRTVALCDYVYIEESRDAQGNLHSTNHWMSVGMVTLRQALPGLQLMPESIGRTLLNFMSLGNDIQFESEEFNRRFTVLSEDRDFAFTLVDTQMMEWLMVAADDCFLEIVSNRLLVAHRQLPWEDTPRLLELASGFGERFPRLVWELYGAGR